MFVIDSLLGLLAIIGLAYGLDYWIQSLLETGYQTFDMAPYLNGSIVANLSIALALLILAWYVRYRGRREPILAIVFLFVGLGITLLPILMLNIPSSAQILSSPEIRVLRVGFLYSSTISRLQIAGAFVAVIGLANLLPRQTDRIELLWARLWQAS